MSWSLSVDPYRLRPETASRTLLEHRAQSAERHLAVAVASDAEASTGLRRLSLRLEEAEEEAESSGSGLARALAERQALERRLGAAEAAGKQMEAKASEVLGRCRAVGAPFQHAASIFGPCLGL